MHVSNNRIYEVQNLAGDAVTLGNAGESYCLCTCFEGRFKAANKLEVRKQVQLTQSLLSGSIATKQLA